MTLSQRQLFKVAELAFSQLADISVIHSTQQLNGIFLVFWDRSLGVCSTRAPTFVRTPIRRPILFGGANVAAVGQKSVGLVVELRLRLRRHAKNSWHRQPGANVIKLFIFVIHFLAK
jgi:hypothetical protein